MKITYKYEVKKCPTPYPGEEKPAENKTTGGGGANTTTGGNKTTGGNATTGGNSTAGAGASTANGPNDPPCKTVKPFDIEFWKM